MSKEDDVLLREVDEDLKYDKQLAFLKDYGPYLLGAAALLVAGVGGFQIWSGMKANERAASAEAFFAAALETPEDAAQGADAMAQIAGQVSPGYRGLARLREAALLIAADKTPEALAALAAVHSDSDLPDRLRDLARLRAGHVLLDADAAAADALAAAVKTPAFRPHADEVRALAALSTGNGEAAFQFLTAIAANEGANASLRSRAEVLAPVADAARRGVALTPDLSEADAFIQSFTDELGAQGILPTPGAAPAVPTPVTATPDEE